MHLGPDVLVVPGRFPIVTTWAERNEYWLAVEIFSRSSKLFDRDFKRDAYIALGLQQVWSIDTRDRSVKVCATQGAGEIERDVIDWFVPALNKTVSIDLAELFRELP